MTNVYIYRERQRERERERERVSKTLCQFQNLLNGGPMFLTTNISWKCIMYQNKYYIVKPYLRGTGKAHMPAHRLLKIDQLYA